jgi:uncharacterized protein (TIGR02246 family)
MTEDERAIRNVVEIWMSATRASDIETVLGLMTEDVVFMTPGREPFGKAEFAAQSSAMKNLRIEGASDIKEIQVSGDWAWLRSHVSVAVTPPNGNVVRRSGYTLTIFRKSGGRWLLARDANLVA